MGYEDSNTPTANKLADYGVMSSAFTETFCHAELNNIADILAEIRLELNVSGDDLFLGTRVTALEKDWLRSKIEAVLACYYRIDVLKLPLDERDRCRTVRFLSAVENLGFSYRRKEDGFAPVLRKLPVMIKLYASPSLETA